MSYAELSQDEQARLNADIIMYKKQGPGVLSGAAPGRLRQVLDEIERRKNTVETVHGIPLSRVGTLDRTVADIRRGTRSVPTSQLNPEQRQQLEKARLNDEARAGRLTPEQYSQRLTSIGEQYAAEAQTRSIESARRAAPGLQAAAAAERERFANIGITNFSAQEAAQTKQLQKVESEIAKVGIDPARLVQSVGRPNPRRDLKINTAAEIQQNIFAREQAFRTVSSTRPKQKEVSLSESLSFSDKTTTSQLKPIIQASMKPESKTLIRVASEYDYILPKPTPLKSSVAMSYYTPKPVKKLTRGEARAKGTGRMSEVDILDSAIGKVNAKSDTFRKSQEVRRSPVGIIDSTPKQYFVSPQFPSYSGPFGAAFVSGSEVIAKNYENIAKATNISLKGEGIKITKGKTQKQVSISDAIIIPGTIDYAISENKQPLLLRPYARELDPLKNRADLIETVQRPVKNLARYIIAVPEATKRIIQTGDPLAGEKYFEKEVAPKMRETASTRLFSDWGGLFDPKKLPENIISAATEIAMYAFIGGKGGRIGKPSPKSETPFIESLPTQTYVPKNAYISRRVPRDIFKADKAQPSNFKETKISLGKGSGIKFDPSTGGLTIGKAPKGKPPSTFTSTKTELGTGTGKLPFLEIKPKGGQILLQQQKTIKKQTTKQTPFKSYPVRLGEAEAKIVKQITKPKEKLYPLQTPQKKKQKTTISQYVTEQEIIRYPSTPQQGFQFTDKLQTFVIPFQEKQKQPLIISQIVNPKQRQRQEEKFFFGTRLQTAVTTKQTPKQKQDQNFFFGDLVTTKQTPKLATPQIPKFAVPVIPTQSQTFFIPEPQRDVPKTPGRGFIFPPFIPGAYFGGGGFGDMGSLKKGFAAYGISSDINIKTLPTYSRYSAGTGIFQAQAKEDKRIQELFYGKPRRKSKKSKKKSRKR